MTAFAEEVGTTPRRTKSKRKAPARVRARRQKGRVKRKASSAESLEELRRLNGILEQRVAERTKWLTLMHDVTRIVSDAASWDEVLRLIVRHICEAEKWQLGYVYLPDKDAPSELLPAVTCSQGERFQLFHLATQKMRFARKQSLPGRVYAEAKPIWVDGQEDVLRVLPFRADAAQKIGLTAAMAVPVTIGRETIAVLEFFSDQPHPPSEDFIKLMNDVGAQVSRVVERERLMAQVADMVWREQQNLLHTLHDSIGQELTGLGMLSSGLSQQLRGKDTAAAETAQQITHGAQQALEHVRQLSKGLLPVEVDAGGLMVALRQLASTTENLYKIRCRAEDHVPVFIQDNRIATELYRIAQEAVTNALKHAKAHEILIQLRAEAGTTTLTIVDDGIGIQKPALAGDGMGLRIMQYRAMSIGANLSIEPGARAGTCVTCTLREAPRPIKTGRV